MCVCVRRCLPDLCAFPPIPLGCVFFGGGIPQALLVWYGSYKCAGCGSLVVEQNPETIRRNIHIGDGHVMVPIFPPLLMSCTLDIWRGEKGDWRMHGGGKFYFPSQWKCDTDRDPPVQITRLQFG